jgi:plasmid stabilization system protein ParE
MGRARDDLRLGLRSLSVERYLVICHVLADTVEIVGVIHGSRDIVALITDDT